MPQEQSTPTGALTTTYEQLQELLMTAAREFKKPSAEEQAKLDKEKARREQAALESCIMAEEAEKQKQAVISACAAGGHKKENGRSAIQGQIHSDGKFHGICFHCQWEAPPVAMAPESFAGGIEYGGSSPFTFGSAPSAAA